MEIVYNPQNEMVFSLKGSTFEIEVITLRSHTDSHNDILEKKTLIPHCGKVSASGKLFFIKNYIEKSSLIVLSMTPDIADAKITLDNSELKVEPQGFPFAYIHCPLGEEEKQTRAFLLNQTKNSRIFSLVNNWGDLNMGENINYDFYEKEIDTAKELGADAVQIDDGWQCGSTQKTRIYKEDGSYTFYHDFYDGFWEVDHSKFPQGLTPIVEYAKKKDIAIGLWFAPDSRDCFKNYERDINYLKQAYLDGFRYFKLDMVVIQSAEAEGKFIRMLNEISEIGDDLHIQIDVTGDIERLGYFRGFEYGKIFVENRFCKDRGYYPHLTLKNLWKLSGYYPAQSLQFEIPNRKSFAEYYSENDALAPEKYTSDYLFASVMVSNPLLWMEVQKLSEEDRQDLAGIIDKWKEHRESLSKTDISPVGNEPNGSSLTGFLCIGDKYGYVIALREVCDENEFTVSLPSPSENLQIIAASDGTKAEIIDTTLTVHFTDKRQYAFCRFDNIQ